MANTMHRRCIYTNAGESVIKGTKFADKRKNVVLLHHLSVSYKGYTIGLSRQMARQVSDGTESS
jgi:hypothetical protein